MINNYNDHIGIIFPISNKVLLPDVVTTVRLEALGEAQMTYLENHEAVKIALPLKQNAGKNPEDGRGFLPDRRDFLKSRNWIRRKKELCFPLS